MAAVVPARRCEQSRRERARPRVHRSDDRRYTGFDNANPTTESGPALNYVPVPISLPMAEKWLAERWGGERWRRSFRRGGVKQSRRERARPRAHQSDDRCYTGFDNANPATESLPALNYVPVPISLPMAEKWLAERWGGERWRRSSRRGGVSNGARSAPVPGRINPTTDVAPVSMR